jgi:hypothetical protein
MVGVGHVPLSVRHAGSGCETFHALVFSSAGWNLARIQAALYRAALLALATITLDRKRKAIATGEPVTLAVDE